MNYLREKKIFSKPLTQNEAKIIIFRFRDRLSYAKIGKSINLSYQRIRAIEAKALRKIEYQALDVNLADKIINLVKDALRGIK